MIKIALCDDEESFLHSMEEKLRNYEKIVNEVFCIKKYTKPLQLMNSLAEDFQVFFLYIQMPNLNGIELAEIIRKYDKKSTIVFVTSYQDFNRYCLELEADNYIIKPITQIQVDYEMNRVIKKIKSTEQDYIGLKSNDGFMKVFLSDIEYIETVGRKVMFHCDKSGDIIARFKIQDLERRLGNYPFVRCHNGVIVNLDYISSLIGFTILLTDGTPIYTTKSRKKEIIRRLTERGIM